MGERERNQSSYDRGDRDEHRGEGRDRDYHERHYGDSARSGHDDRDYGARYTGYESQRFQAPGQSQGQGQGSNFASSGYYGGQRNEQQQSDRNRRYEGENRDYSSSASGRPYGFDRNYARSSLGGYSEGLYEDSQWSRVPTQEHYGNRAREFGQRDSGQRDYNQLDYSQRAYGQRDFGQRDFGQRDFGQRDFGQRDYSRPDYSQRAYGQRDFGQHDSGQRDWVERAYSRGGYGYGNEGAYRGYGNEGYRNRDHDDSWGQQLRDVGNQVARRVKRAFRGPKGYKRSDERIREDVNDRLSQQDEVDPSEIEVAVSNGDVTLTGTVQSRHEKFLAEEIADDISGVNEVHNQLRVRREQRGATGSTTDTSTSTTGSSAGVVNQNANRRTA